MNKNTVVAGLVCAVLFGGAGYYVGSTHKSASATRFVGAAPASGNAAFSARGAAGMRGGSNIFGTILSKDENGITISISGSPTASSTGAAPGTRIILIDSSTQIQKIQGGSAGDLRPGTAVTVTGSANTDGSLTATELEIRPKVQGR